MLSLPSTMLAGRKAPPFVVKKKAFPPSSRVKEKALLLEPESY